MTLIQLAAREYTDNNYTRSVGATFGFRFYGTHYIHCTNGPLVIMAKPINGVVQYHAEGSNVTEHWSHIAAVIDCAQAWFNEAKRGKAS